MSIRKIVLLIVAMGLWLCSLTGAHSSSTVEMRWSETTIKHMALASTLKAIDRPVRGVIWSIKTSDKRKVATYAGDPLLLVGDCMINGSAVVCAVSRSTALSLWGSVNVLGLTLTLDGQDYVVGGVYDAGVADVLVAWDSIEEVPFHQMILRFPGEPDGAQYQKALDFTAMLGMGVPDDVLDTALLSGVARAITKLPGWVLICLVLITQWHILYSVTILRIPVRLPIVILSLLSMVWALDVSLIPPRWLLPSRWSDFEHWGDLAREIGCRIAGFLHAVHNPLNIRDLYACMRTSAIGLLSGLILYDIRGGWNYAQNMAHTDAHHHML